LNTDNNTDIVLPLSQKDQQNNICNSIYDAVAGQNENFIEQPLIQLVKYIKDNTNPDDKYKSLVMNIYNTEFIQSHKNDIKKYPDMYLESVLLNNNKYDCDLVNNNCC
jgi:hypothetical protein